MQRNSSLSLDDFDSDGGDSKSAEATKKKLRVQIAQEKRLVRIYEAELSLLRHSSRKRQRCQAAATSSPDTNETERDWLETLDALQSNTASSENGTIQLGTRWQDDPEMYRLLPLIGGICFTSTLPRAPPIQGNNEPHRTYELKGKVTAKNATPVAFTVLVTIELHNDVLNSRNADTARVVGIECSFVMDSNVSAKQELDEISSIASETCSLPHFFRQLVCWAEFDARRSGAFEAWQDDYGFSSLVRLAAGTFRIELGNVGKSSGGYELSMDAGTTRKQVTKLSLLLSWKWSCAWFGSGEEELKVLDCIVDSFAAQPPALQLWIKEIRDPKGLQDLLTCVGSCEQAVQVILRTLLGTPEDKSAHD